jgi:hypothetical protein
MQLFYPVIKTRPGVPGFFQPLRRFIMLELYEVIELEVIEITISEGV